MKKRNRRRTQQTKSATGIENQAKGEADIRQTSFLGRFACGKWRFTIEEPSDLWSLPKDRLIKVLRTTARLILDHVDHEERLTNRHITIGWGNTPCTPFSSSAWKIILAPNGDACGWAQIVFQFGHELCHALCRGQTQECLDDICLQYCSSGAIWFEEMLCETASLFVLAKWPDNIKVHADCPQEQLQKPDKQIFVDFLYAQPRLGAELPQEWYQKNRGNLEEMGKLIQDKNASADKKDRLRQAIRMLALCSLLPLFSNKPTLWNDLSAINEWWRQEHDTGSIASILQMMPDSSFKKEIAAIFLS